MRFRGRHFIEDDEEEDGSRTRYFHYVTQADFIESRLPHPRVSERHPDCLMEVKIPKWIRKIDDDAFGDCYWLTQVHLTEGLVEIGENAFRGCRSLRKMHIPPTTKRIGKYAFAKCEELVYIKLSNRLRRLEEGTFYGCLSLVKIGIPDSLVVIERDAFHGCKALRTVYPEEASINLEEIGENAFVGAALQKFTIPATMNTIGRHAFRLCTALREVQVEEGVEEGVEIIGTAAFEQCTSLHAVRLPRSLKRIGNRAFDDCQNLVSVEVMNATNNIWLGEEAFQSCPSLVNIFVPSHSAPFCSGGYSIHFTCFDDCETLERLQSNDDVDNGAIQAVSSRFDEYPIHRLCYYASSTTVDQLRLAVEAKSKQESELMEDYENYLLDDFQMTPFHVLLSSAKPRKDLLQILLHAYPSYVLNWKDCNGKLAIHYLRCTSTAEWDLVLHTLLKRWLLKPIATWGLESWKAKMAPKLDSILAVYQQSHYVEDLVLHDARDTLKAYEKYEHTRLLELALWKMEMTDFSGDANIGPRFQYNSEDDDDDDDDVTTTSENREACRIRCGASIVVPHVVSFYNRQGALDRSGHTVRFDVR